MFGRIKKKKEDQMTTTSMGKKKKKSLLKVWLIFLEVYRVFGRGI